jgi:hypothetical protein
MMKLVSLYGVIIITSSAAAATAAEDTRQGSRKMTPMTTMELELETKRFIQANKIGPRATPSSTRTKDKQRTLRHHTSMNDDTVMQQQQQQNSKSGKSSSSNNDLFYLLPAACPNNCISSYTNEYNEMKDSVKICEHDEPSQQWLVRSDGSYIMIESYDYPGMCISFDYVSGDNDVTVSQLCEDGVLVLRDCNSIYGTEWYFTGGNLISSLCWAAGLPSMMTVAVADPTRYECSKDVSIFGKMGEAVLKADTFMFVNRLPMSPFIITNVSAALEGKTESVEPYDDEKPLRPDDEKPLKPSDDEKPIKPEKQPRSGVGVISHFDDLN